MFLYDKNTNIEIIFDALNIDFYIHLYSIKMKPDSTQMKRMTLLFTEISSISIMPVKVRYLLIMNHSIFEMHSIHYQ